MTKRELPMNLDPTQLDTIMSKVNALAAVQIESVEETASDDLEGYTEYTPQAEKTGEDIDEPLEDVTLEEPTETQDDTTKQSEDLAENSATPFVSPFDTVGQETIPTSLGEIQAPEYGGTFKEINETKMESPQVIPPPVIQPNLVQDQLQTATVPPTSEPPILTPVLANVPPSGVGVGSAAPQIASYTPPTVTQGMTIEDAKALAKGATPNLNNVSLSGLQETTEEQKVFAGVLNFGEKSLELKDLLLRTFNRVNIFKNEYNVLYALIHDKPRITLTEDFIRLYLQVNRPIYINNPSVSLINYKMGENDEYAEFINSTIAEFQRIKSVKLTEDEFHTALESVRLRYVAENSVTMLEESLKILTEGMSIRGASYKGYEGMRKWITQSVTKIDNVVEQSDKKGTFVIDANYMNENQDGNLELVTTFGIEVLDRHLGGVYEGDMVTFLAPEKGFKTRASICVCHTSVISGKNTGIWALENGEKGVMALLRAKHFDYYYNKGETSVEKRKVIDPDWIRKGTVPDELKALEWISFQDLVTNEAYGEIIIFDHDFDVYTFEDHLIKAVKERNMKMLLIDYLQLVPPARDLDKSKTIGLAYQKSLQFLKRYKVGGVFPAQIKQDAIDHISKKGDQNLATLELRSIGGESAETLRTPDVLLFLYGTMEDLLKCKLQIVGLPSRNSSPFAPEKIIVQPETCSFHSVPDEMW